MNIVLSYFIIMEKQYDRQNAINYAITWAKSRNPRYYNFDNIGGDCTNFVSQCLYAGCNVMNYSKQNGWFYIDLHNRAPAWTGVEFLFDFLTTSKGVGPFGKIVDYSQVEIGDLVFLSKNNRLFHSLIISKIENQNILVCSHTRNALNVPLNYFVFNKANFVKIIACRI